MALSWCAFLGHLTCRPGRLRGGLEPRVDSAVPPGGPAGFDGGKGDREEARRAAHDGVWEPCAPFVLPSEVDSRRGDRRRSWNRHVHDRSPSERRGGCNLACANAPQPERGHGGVVVGRLVSRGKRVRRGGVSVVSRGDPHPGRAMEWHHMVDSQHAQPRSRRRFLDCRVVPLGQRVRRGGIDGLQQRWNSVRTHRTLERKLVVGHQDQSRRRGKRRVRRGVVCVGVGVHRGGQHLQLL